jgi:hypothetical protein
MSSGIAARMQNRAAESYGFHDVYDETADASIHVWTEDYDLTKSDALETLADKCE